MHCKKCGKELEKDSKKCDSCGTESNKKSGGSKVLNLILGVFAAIVSGYVAYNFVMPFLFPNTTLEDGLKQSAAELNKNVPQKLNETTQLVSASVEGKSLVYHYKYTGNPITQADLDGSTKTSIIKSDCENTDTRKLLDLGGTLNYSYADSASKVIGNIIVTSKDCK